MRKLLAVAVTVFAVTACAAETGPGRAGPPPAACGGTGTTLSTAKASAGPAGLLTAGEPLRAGELLLAAGSTGELLIESGRQDTPSADGPTILRPGTLSVLDPATGRRQVVRGKGHLQPGTQTVFGDLDRDHAVWLQKTGTTLSESDWRLYAADRRSGAISLVARARHRATIPGYTIPRLHDGTVYWAGARAGSPLRPGVYARRLDAAAPERLVVPDAVLPVVSDSWLYYADYPAHQGSTPGYTIHRRSLRTGRSEVVRRSATGPAVEFLAADGDTVGWVLTDGTVQVRPAPGRPVVSVSASADEQLSWIGAAPGLIGFGDGSGQAGGAYVLDLRTNCLYDLAPAGGSDVVLGGPTVAWSVAAADGTLRWQVARH